MTISGDIAHLGHVEMYTDKFDESLDFFTRVYGLTESEDATAPICGRGTTMSPPLKLTRHHYDRRGPYRLIVRRLRRRWRGVSRIEASRISGIGWLDGDRATAVPFASRSLRPCVRDLLRHRTLRAPAQNARA